MRIVRSDLDSETLTRFLANGNFVKQDAGKRMTPLAKIAKGQSRTPCNETFATFSCSHAR